MSTYYKYAERAVENQTDWSKIGSDFTTMLKTESELREKKKADIETATQQTLKTLADSPTGLDRGVNENILNYSSDSQKYMLMMNRLLKSGQLDPKDYSIYTQNLKTDTEKMFQTTKLYQEKYAEGVERAKTGTSAEQEVYLRSLVENAANFSKSKFYINNNGRVTVGLPQKDPATGQYVLNEDPNTYNSIDALRYAATVKIDKYDVDKEVANVVSSFGKEIQASAKLEGRVIRTIEDIKARKGYEVMEQRYIDSLLVNPNSSASILTDWIKTKGGKVYGFSNNPDDPQVKSGEKILMIADPANPTSGVLTPQLNAEQKKEAENFLRDRIRMGLDYEAKTQYFEPPQPSEARLDRADKEKEQASAVGLWGDFFKAPTPERKREIAESIVGTPIAVSNGLLGINTDNPGEITLTYADKNRNRTIKYDPKTVDYNTWLKLGTEIHGVADKTKLSRYGGGSSTQRMSAGQQNFTGASAGRIPVQDPAMQFSDYLNNKINSQVTKKESTTLPALRANYGDLGYKFAGTGVIGNYIKITSPDGKTVSDEIDLSSTDAATQIASFMEGHRNDDLLETASKKGKFNLSKPNPKPTQNKNGVGSKY